MLIPEVACGHGGILHGKGLDGNAGVGQGAALAHVGLDGDHAVVAVNDPSVGIAEIEMGGIVFRTETALGQGGILGSVITGCTQHGAKTQKQDQKRSLHLIIFSFGNSIDRGFSADDLLVFVGDLDLKNSGVFPSI